MKVFLSWSGDLSHKVACVFRDWLPSVIQSVVPYVSSEDIDKGARWSTDIAKELNESSYGIIIVTEENIVAPWINFEAGALSKSIDKSYVTPFLFNVKRSDLPNGPLLQFQSTIYERADIFKLLQGINKKLEEKESLDEHRLEKAFGAWWSDLKNSLDNLSKAIVSNSKVVKKDPQKNEILEELLELSRNQQRLLSRPENLLPPNYMEFIFDRFSGVRPRLPSKEYDILHKDVIKLEEFIREKLKDGEEKAFITSLIRNIHSGVHKVRNTRIRRPTINERIERGNIKEDEDIEELL